MKKCLVRFDDICPTMDWTQFYRAVELMNKYNIKPLLGIIPLNEDPDQMIDEENTQFWNKMQELQKAGWTMALHGYTHVYDKENPKTIICGRKHSEFAGNTYRNQYEKIKKGKNILNEHGINTNVFLAPAHTYDKRTLIALRENGFEYISDGLSLRPYKQNGIICIPAKYFGIPPVNKKGICVAVNHSSEWSRKEKQNDYFCLERFCEENKNNFVSFQELQNENISNFLVQKICEKLFILKIRAKSLLKKIYRGIIK